jgi:hypothetical protein
MLFDPETLSKHILLLMKLDSDNVFNRINLRREEYIGIFALKRTRVHFAEIFNNRYDLARVEDLKYCGTETLTALNNFYSIVDEFRWYLTYTEDMPFTVREMADVMVVRLRKALEWLHKCIDAELGTPPTTPETPTGSEETI